MRLHLTTMQNVQIKFLAEKYSEHVLHNKFLKRHCSQKPRRINFFKVINSSR